MNWVNFLSISISFLALFAVIAQAILYKYFQGQANASVLNQQIVNHTTELISLFAENAGHLEQPLEKRNHSVYQANIQKITSLTRQVIFLSEQKKATLSDIQFVVIAQALNMIFDFVQADLFWNKAIQSSPNSFYKINNLRAYADFLFQQDDHEGGRQKYREALQILKNDCDFHKYTNAHTYLMWFTSEANCVSLDIAEEYYAKAESLYNGIGKSSLRSTGIDSLQLQKQRFTQPCTNIEQQKLKTEDIFAPFRNRMSRKSHTSSLEPESDTNPSK